MPHWVIISTEYLKVTASEAEAYGGLGNDTCWIGPSHGPQRRIIVEDIFHNLPPDIPSDCSILGSSSSQESFLSLSSPSSISSPSSKSSPSSVSSKTLNSKLSKPYLLKAR